MEAKNTIIIVSRYQRDTSWTKAFVDRGYVTLVYEHGGPTSSPNNPYNSQLNKGKEGLSYMRYIVDKYDSLPMYSVFLHDKMESWHHKGNITDLVLANEGKSSGYKNFNNMLCASIENPVWKQTKWYFKKFLSPYIGPMDLYGDWTVNQLCCAQFVVTRSKIRQHPVKMYEDIHNWLATSDMDPEITGRLLEWTYRLIFNPKETRLPKSVDVEKEWTKERAENGGRRKKQVVPKALVDKGYRLIGAKQ